MTDTVPVTSASGFIAGHTIQALTERGYAVRGTARSPEKGASLRERFPAVETALADLGADAGWDAAARGCAFVLHMASPFPSEVPRERDDLVRPAVDGTRRVMAAASKAGARRVVVTSSVAAVAYGHDAREAPFDETDWTDPDDPRVGAYLASKTLVEKAA